jgi:GntR family transcriptional regulator
MNELSHAAPVGLTLYKEVKRQMLAALSASEWAPGDAIPSEKQLCLRFGVSIGTLRKAIDELVAENILIRHQGRGTFVAVHNRGPHLFRFFNVVRHDGQKSYPQLTLNAFAKIKGDKAVCDKLGVAAGAEVFQFTNVRSLNDEPVLVDEITLPEILFPGMTEVQLRDRPSTLYNLYQVAYGLNVIRIEERVRATLASAVHAELLNIEPGMPLLQIHRVAFSYNNQPIEYRVSYVNTQRYEYFPSVA